jgi:NitT/TauT family transport system permease protein
VSEANLAPEPLAQLAVRRGGWRPAIQKLRNASTPLIGLVVLLLLWAIVTTAFQVPEYLLPSPPSVFRRIVLERGMLAANTASTLIEVFAGFLASVLIGIPAAFCIVMSRTVERIVMPVIVGSQAVPKVAIAPMLVIWLGFGLLPKIAITFLLAFFPVLVATSTGLRSVETEMIDLVRSMRASVWKVMFKVRLPAALPQIFSGLKVAVSLSVVGAVVGEFVGADRGIGYVLLSASGALDGTLVWAALIILVAVGVASFQAIAAIERFAIGWHVSVRQHASTVLTS